MSCDYHLHHFYYYTGSDHFAGNYYSITNDYEVPARIFFAQACEVALPLEEELPEGSYEEEQKT